MMLSLFLFLQVVQLSAQEIALRMDQVDRGKDVQGQMQMKIITAQAYEKERHIHFSRMSLGENDKLYFEFEQPADVKGTRFLFWSQADSANSVWLFLPALRKARRLSGGSQYESFMGSDFLYEDLNRRSPTKDRFEGGQMQACGEKQCYLIEAYPKDELPYAKRKIWVRSDNFLPVRIEFYGADGLVLKEQENSDIRIHQGVWTVFSSVMSQKKNSSKTVIKFEKLDYNKGLQEKDFSVSRLR